MKESKKYENLDLKINRDYLREDATGFSLAPKGEEEDIEFGKCNYYTDRKAGASPQYIIQTYSVGSLEHTLEEMVLPNGGDISSLRGKAVSVHYIINTDGEIYNLVPVNQKPWAAGIGGLKTGSKLNSDIQGDMKNSMNDFCISIMSINDGKSPFTPEQYESNLQLTSNLVDAYKIDPKKVIALSDWTPGRHIAPGPYYDWEAFSKEGFGLWAHNVELKETPELIVSYKQKPFSLEVEHIQQALKELSNKHLNGSSSELFAKYKDATTTFAKEFPDSIIKDIDCKLTNDLGMIGVNNAQDPEGHLGSSTLSSMLCFNLHYLGKEIINSERKEIYDDVLWKDSSNPDARGILAQWTENSEAMLNDILDSALLGGANVDLDI